MFNIWIAGLWFASGVCAAAESPTNRAPAANFRELSPGVFAIGQVILRKEARTVSIPVQINQRSNMVEYAVVTENGKTHESLLKTVADPMHVHLAMLLLGARPSSTNVLGGSLTTPPPGQPIRIETQWQQNEQEIRRPLESLIVYSTNIQQTLPAGSWLYNGSYMDRGRFMASLDGSIVSLQEDAMALVNNPRPDRFNDDIHFVYSSALPPDGVPIELVFILPPDSSATNAPAPPR